MTKGNGIRAVASGVILLAVGGGVAAATASTEPAVDRDIAVDRWLLLGAKKAPGGGAIALVRAVEDLEDCERSTASVVRRKSGYRVTVRRVREGCDGPQPSIAILPPTVAVRLPGKLKGQRIAGPGYDGVGAAAAGDPAVPHLIGIKGTTALSILKAADLKVSDADLPRYVRQQSPSGGSKITRNSEPTVSLQ